MRLALMIEGQEDVTWQDWLALASMCEQIGIEALFRSDHYLSVEGEHDRGSLDAWGTICALAACTSTLRLGTLVSPASFRHPSILAKLATTADHVSGGRIEVGLGAGWSEIEHTSFGFEFLSLRERMDVLEEQLAIVHGHWRAGPFSFDGAHYAVEALDALPKPVQRPRPPLVMGGSGGPRSLALAARFADEYNAMGSVDEMDAHRDALAAACVAAGRSPIPLSLMIATTLGDPRRGWGEAQLAGSVDAMLARLREYAEVGVMRVYLNVDHRDLETVRAIGEQLRPALA